MTAQSKPNIWVFSLEPLESRYTCEWLHGIPDALVARVGAENYQIKNVLGTQIDTSVSTGGFLNFSDTNYWKSTQLISFLDAHNRGETTDQDKFLFTDFWNPAAIQIKYISDLMGKKWELHGICHAGSYDPADFLGRLPVDGQWARAQEYAYYHAYDRLYFATDFHRRMFLNNVLLATNNVGDTKGNLYLSGQPHEKLTKTLASVDITNKRDLILFPHRIAVEKQPEIFRDLKEQLPEYEFVICQEKSLTKAQYHELLAASKLTFSANLQETMGISSCIEAPLLGSLPLVPDRLSYSEVFSEYQDFLYPEEWTANWESYLKHREHLVATIHEMMLNYDKKAEALSEFVNQKLPQYTSASAMFDSIIRNRT